MSTIRFSQSRNFFAAPNELAQDSSLSLECRGLLFYLLSKPDDWECRISDIEREGNMGRHQRRRIMREAEMAGYLTFSRTRSSQGHFQSHYQLYNSPLPASERTRSYEQAEEIDDFTRGQLPTGGQTACGKPTPLINTDLQNTEGNEVIPPPEAGEITTSKSRRAHARASLQATPALRGKPLVESERKKPAFAGIPEGMKINWG